MVILSKVTYGGLMNIYPQICIILINIIVFGIAHHLKLVFE
jgi:hypothetical protein